VIFRELPPLRFPDLEAGGVKLHGPSACCKGDSLDGHLFSRHGQLAGVARRPVARSTEDSRDAILRKTAILELVRDEDVQSFVVHGVDLSGVAISPKA
jgi:hypothetical protein